MIRLVDRPSAKKPKAVKLPLLMTTCPAGFPSPADDYLDGAIDLNEKLIAHPAATFLMRVSGSSMTDVGIFDGSLLVVDRALEAKDGSIVVAVVEGSLTVKRLKMIRGRPWLVPASKEFQPIEITDESFQVWGVVAFVIHQPR
jgi:DNA polymerase V